MPQTHGLLGAMLESPAPFRTEDLHTEPRFRGWWPDGHPDMRSAEAFGDQDARPAKAAVPPQMGRAISLRCSSERCFTASRMVTLEARLARGLSQP